MFRPLTTLLVTIVLMGSAGTTEAVARHDNQVPPFRETRNYLHRVRSLTTVTNRELATTPVHGQTIYETYELVDGLRIRSYSDVPPVPRRATTSPTLVP